jgi:hypothetical protein
LKRLVIDANTLASGSLDPHGESPPCLLYGELAGARFEAILCPELLGEVTDTLRKPYFLERVGEDGSGTSSPGSPKPGPFWRTRSRSTPSCAIPRTTTSSPLPERRGPRRSSRATVTCWTTPVSLSRGRSIRARPVSCSG